MYVSYTEWHYIIAIPCFADFCPENDDIVIEQVSLRFAKS